MKLAMNKAITGSNWFSNMIARADDMNFGSTSKYTNFTNMLALLVGTSDVNIVLTGLELLIDTGLVTELSAGGVLSFDGSYVDVDGAWGFNAGAGEVFSVTVPDIGVIAFSSADPTNPRIDVVEIRPVQTIYNEKSRKFKDPITSAITSTPTYVKMEYGYEYNIVVGTPASSPVAPASNAGWVKIAEVSIGASQTTLTQNDIKDVRDSDIWTTGMNNTIKNQPIFDRIVSRSSGFTLSDSNEIAVIKMTTGGSNQTVTLPTAYDNQDREITLIKVDSGSGKAILDGENTETINSTLTWEITEQWGRVKVKSDGSNWIVLEQCGCIYEMWNTTDYVLTASWVNYYSLSGLTAGTYRIEFFCGARLGVGGNAIQATIATTSGVQDSSQYSVIHWNNDLTDVGSLYKSFIRTFLSVTTLYFNALEGSGNGDILNNTSADAYIRATRIG